MAVISQKALIESSACHHPPYPTPFYSSDNRTVNIIGGVTGMFLSHIKNIYEAFFSTEFSYVQMG